MTHHGITLHIDGKVQGVGFRPVVWQLAHALGLRGDVSNNGEGVIIHLWQDEATLQAKTVGTFLESLKQNCPPLALISSIHTEPYTWENEPQTFTIIQSSGGKVKTNIIPDAATCPACLAEVNDPANRRYRYPFTNCTHCGPRFTIVEKIPYDRAHTSMKMFPMCPACQKEYENPADRRFHAQPNACPVCGPHIFLCGKDGHTTAERHDALEQAAQALLQGQIVAIKGLGGLHLACDATNTQAVALLRQRKTRPSKPLAVMLPDATWLARCVATEHENDERELTQLLESPSAPIVLSPMLAPHSAHSPLSPEIAPGLNEVGVMLPANPLQHLLMQEVQKPLVMTSGNAKGKPPALSNAQALEELQGIADLWLMHDRNIVQRADDSVVRFDATALAKMEMIRRARGYVPDALPLPQGFQNNAPILALGGDLKNAFCILREDHAVMSQHFGDLEDLQIQQQVEQGIALFENIYEFKPQAIAIDAHPSYISHQVGKRLADGLHVPIIEVQHHHAHMAACMAEHGISKDHPPIIGLALDGLGYGQNGQLWGGECLLVSYTHCFHLGGLPAVALPGGNLASRQPWRNLLAHLQQFVPDWQTRAEAAYIPQDNQSAILQAIERGLNAPLASSAGRLFDAVATALGIAPFTLSWEGEAACALEALAQQSQFVSDAATAQHLPVTMPVLSSTDHKKYVLDLKTFWQQWLNWQATPADRAYAFHHALAQGMANLARLAAQEHDTRIMALSGGVVHNHLLRRLLLDALKGYQVLLPQQLPAGDGGIALGQTLVAQSIHDEARKDLLSIKTLDRNGNIVQAGSFVRLVNDEGVFTHILQQIENNNEITNIRAMLNKTFCVHSIQENGLIQLIGSQTSNKEDLEVHIQMVLSKHIELVSPLKTSSHVDAHEISRIAQGWIEQYKTSGSYDESFWAFEAMYDLLDTSPEQVFLVIDEVLLHTDDESVLCNLAAGPLEDLLRVYRETFMPQIEFRVKSNKKFKSLLPLMYQVTSDELWKRIMDLADWNDAS